MHDDLIPDQKLADTVSTLEAKEKERFLSLAKMMLSWLPEERNTACELIEHSHSCKLNDLHYLHRLDNSKVQTYSTK